MEVIMSFTKAVEKLKTETKISLLTFEGKNIGFRASIYDVEKDAMNYYDFSLSSVKDKKLQNFLNSIQNKFDTIPTRNVNGLFTTDMELQSNIIVQEFKDEESLNRIMSVFYHIYQ